MTAPAQAIAAPEDQAGNRNLMERFFEACGATGPWLVDVHDDGAIHRARRIFHQPFLVCGRHPDADLELKDEGVSRRHCYVQAVGGRIFAIDLGTRAGIRVDGVGCRMGWLDGSREMRLGPVGLRVRGRDRYEEAASPELPSPLSARYAIEHPLPEVTLEIGNGGARVQSWPMRRVLVLVGRSACCQLRLDSPLVSDVHCALLRTESGVWLIDLLSQGGVYVDGMAVRFACLGAGAEVGVGPFTIQVREGCDAEPSLDLRDHPISFSAFGEPAGSMAEQLRQVLRMAQTARAMQRDQRQAIQEASRDLGGLADELRALRSELAAQPQPQLQSIATMDVPPELEIGPELGGAEPGDFDFGFEWQEGLASIFRKILAETAASSDRLTESARADSHRRSVDHQSREELPRGPRSDPRAIHAIASQFISAHKLEDLSLREKLVRALLGPHGATDVVGRSS